MMSGDHPENLWVACELRNQLALDRVVDRAGTLSLMTDPDTRDFHFIQMSHRPTKKRAQLIGVLSMAFALAACAPRVHLPPLPLAPPGLLSPDDPAAQLAMRLAPHLFIQRDEPFPLVRVAAVVHPSRPVIAYHLLWQHDVNGQWLPWAKPSDEEVVWVGYDSVTHAPTDLWTYWHGTILHTDWRGHGEPAVDVQWGKHGSLPHGVIESDLPRLKTLNAFYAVEFALLPDILIGKLAHGGPWGFFHGYRRYREFTKSLPLSTRLDAIIRTADPRDALHAVFGARYSNKVHWPWKSSTVR
jgi:hypothetical protein